MAVRVPNTLFCLVYLGYHRKQANRKMLGDTSVKFSYASTN